MTVTCFLTSLGRYAHNAERLCEYPNLPGRFTRANIHAAWLAIPCVGLVGLALIN